MQAVLQVFPGAQRALFRKYHIGGCSSCGFQPEETLAGVCERNGDLPVADVLEQIRQSHEEDARILIEPSGLAEPAMKSSARRRSEPYFASSLATSAISSATSANAVSAGNSELDHQPAGFWFS